MTWFAVLYQEDSECPSATLTASFAGLHRFTIGTALRRPKASRACSTCTDSLSRTRYARSLSYLSSRAGSLTLSLEETGLRRLNGASVGWH